MIGERTPRTWGENVWPTAQQLADWLKVCTDNERLIHAEIAIRDAQAHDILAVLGTALAAVAHEVGLLAEAVEGW